MTDVTPPRHLAIARDTGQQDILIVVIDTQDLTVLRRIHLPTWDGMRFASAGHRLIEHGWIIDAAAHHEPDTRTGWTDLPGIGYIAPVRRLDKDGRPTDDEDDEQ